LRGVHTHPLCRLVFVLEDNHAEFHQKLPEEDGRPNATLMHVAQDADDDQAPMLFETRVRNWGGDRPRT